MPTKALFINFEDMVPSAMVTTCAQTDTCLILATHTATLFILSLIVTLIKVRLILTIIVTLLVETLGFLYLEPDFCPAAGALDTELRATADSAALNDFDIRSISSAWCRRQ